MRCTAVHNDEVCCVCFREDEEEGCSCGSACRKHATNIKFEQCEADDECIKQVCLICSGEHSITDIVCCCACLKKLTGESCNHGDNSNTPPLSPSRSNAPSSNSPGNTFMTLGDRSKVNNLLDLCANELENDPRMLDNQVGVPDTEQPNQLLLALRNKTA